MSIVEYLENYIHTTYKIINKDTIHILARGIKDVQGECQCKAIPELTGRGSIMTFHVTLPRQAFRWLGATSTSNDSLGERLESQLW